MLPSSGTRIIPSFGVRPLGDEQIDEAEDSSLQSRSAAPVCPPLGGENLTPVQSRQRRRLRRLVMTGKSTTDSDFVASDVPVPSSSVSRKLDTANGKRKAGAVVEDSDAQIESSRVLPEHRKKIRKTTTSFCFPPSQAANDLHRRSGGHISALYCEAVLAYIRRDDWPVKLLEHYASNDPTGHNRKEAFVDEASALVEAQPVAMTPEQHIQAVAEERGCKKAKVLGMYGQGEWPINGKFAKYTQVKPSRRCAQCAELKRDCFRVDKDEYYTTDVCAVCKMRSKGCSFHGKAAEGE